jgi:hypothetical protein
MSRRFYGFALAYPYYEEEPAAGRDHGAGLAPVPVTNGENAIFPLSTDMRLRPKCHAGKNSGKGHKETSEE